MLTSSPPFCPHFGSHYVSCSLVVLCDLAMLAYLVPVLFSCFVFFGSVGFGAVLGIPGRFFHAIAFGCMHDFKNSETIIK